MPLKKRQKIILAALRDLGGEATTREIAQKTGLNVNGVAQSLGALEQVNCLGGRAGECKWRLKSSVEIHLLVVDDSKESQEAEKLLVEAGYHSTEVRPADDSELAEGMRFPRLITSSGTMIGLEHIRLFLG